MRIRARATVQVRQVPRASISGRRQLVARNRRHVCPGSPSTSSVATQSLETLPELAVDTLAGLAVDTLPELGVDTLAEPTMVTLPELMVDT